MIQFPHCKINLGLSIIEKRADGYHELETVFYPVRLQDMVEVCVDEHSTDPIQFSHTGLNIPGDASSNLCIKAFQLLKKQFPNIPATKIHLHKNNPRYRDWETDRKSTRLNSSHLKLSRMPSSA